MSAVGDIAFISRSGNLCFRSPREIVSTNTVAGVLQALQKLRDRVSKGLFAAGFLSYETAPAFDSAFACRPPGEVPLLWFGIYDGPVDRFRHDAFTFDAGPWEPLISRDEYVAQVARIRQWIAAGDTYQVNYAFPLHAPFRGDTWSWFQLLSAAQQADHCAYANTGRYHVVCASPELFFSLRNGVLRTRPMKGTRPRGRWLDEDEQIAHELERAEKDRAENLMIVDLLRNDMGRISDIQSIHVERMFEVERYPTVFQMTSTIRSRTRADIPETLSALFPSGSVTGAPKVRTMQIIREVEPFPRGVYCGAMGWWSPDGAAEFNVAIRCATVDTAQGEAVYPLGSGITWDSSAEEEYEECINKAAVLAHRPEEFELLESILFEGGFFLLERHLDRLSASARYFGFPIDTGAIRERINSEARTRARDRSGGRYKVRVWAARNGAVRTQWAPVSSNAPVRVGVSKSPVNSRDVFLFHKTTHRKVYEEALRTRPDCDDVLLFNERGELTESTIGNVVIDLDGVRYTPPVDCGLLAGTFRAELLAGGEVRERVLRRKDVFRSREIHLINSVRKWIPVTFADSARP